MRGASTNWARTCTNGARTGSTGNTTPTRPRAIRKGRIPVNGGRRGAGPGVTISISAGAPRARASRLPFNTPKTDFEGSRLTPVNEGDSTRVDVGEGVIAWFWT